MSSVSAPAIALENVSFSYASGQTLTLDAVSIAVRPGEMVGVLGPNGAGKSTLLGVASGLLSPLTGTVSLMGADPSTLPRREVARRLAVVPQREEMAFGFTVREVVLLGRHPHLGPLGVEQPRDHALAEDALRACGAWDLRDRVAQQLSGGEQKRVAIARALAQDAPVLGLDEPTAFLDVHHQIALLDVVRARVDARKLAALLVVHDLNLAAQYCDRLVLMRAGRVLADGPIDDVMTYRRICDTFDVDVYVGVNELLGTRFFVPMRGRGGGGGGAPPRLD